MSATTMASQVGRGGCPWAALGIICGSGCLTEHRASIARCPGSRAARRAGVGHLTLVDGDVVDLSNKNRQVGSWYGGSGAEELVELI